MRRLSEKAMVYGLRGDNGIRLGVERRYNVGPIPRVWLLCVLCIVFWPSRRWSSVVLEDPFGRRTSQQQR